MKIAAISDTHGQRGWRIPPCDVFIHAGDMTAGGTLDEFSDLVDWLDQQKQIAEGILLVPGNHDKCLEEREEVARRLLEDRSNRFALLIDEGVRIGGREFWGSPWTLPFMQWSFMQPEYALETTYKDVPDDLSVLITHGPPYRVCDAIEDRHCGSRALLQTIERQKPAHHVFGHIHAAAGHRAAYNTRCHNVAAMDEAYKMRRECYEFQV